MRKILLTAFVDKLYADVKAQPHRGYVFFLGAGCSKSSGIPIARALTEEWVARLVTERGCDIKEIVPDYDPNNPAASYGAVFCECFHSAELRQEEVERVCRDKIPGFGYVALATLMADQRYQEDFSSVITTNFDDLVADAFYFNTKTRPLVIGHPALTSFIRPYRPTPTILKAHGDQRFEPLNTSDETRALTNSVREAFNILVNRRSIVFAGYGGNDPGVADALCSLSPRLVYWVHDAPPGDALLPFLEKSGAFWVTHRDFDELMLAIWHKFDLPHPAHDRFSPIVEGYEASIVRFAENRAASPYPDVPDLYQQCAESASRSGYFEDDTKQKQAYDALEAQRRDVRFGVEFARTKDPEIVAQRVKNAEDHKFRDPGKIYEEARRELPDSATLALQFARFLRKHDQHDRALEEYDKALAIDPSHEAAKEERGRLIMEHFVNWTANAADDVVLSLHPLAEQAWRRTLPNAAALHLRECVVRTPSENWHITRPRTSSVWTEVEHRIGEQIDEIDGTSCRRIHVFSNAPYALAVLLGHRLDRRFGRGGRGLVFYQYNSKNRTWEDWGPDRRLCVGARGEPFLSANVESTPAEDPRHVVVAFSITHELGREEIGQALAEYNAHGPYAWIGVRPVNGIGSTVLDSHESVDRCVDDLRKVLFDAASEYRQANLHVFYSGPQVILMRAAAKIPVLAVPATLYERIASGSGYVFVPALDMQGEPKLRMGTAAIEEQRSQASPPSPRLEALPPRIHVLAVADEWASRKGGLSTFNRLLCIALSRAGHNVACLVPSATQDERESATKERVHLIEAAEPALPGMTRLCLKPVDPFAPHVVLGHGRVTGDAARIQARSHFAGSLLVHFVHTEPNHIEWFKGDTISADASRKSDERAEIERTLAQQANLVVGVGPVLTRWAKDELITGEQREIPIHQLVPGLNESFSPVKRHPENVYCLVLGRAEDRRLKGLDLALRALQDWPERPPELVIRGVPSNNAAEFADWVHSVAPRVYVRSFDYVEKEETIAADIRKASVVLMPSRREGFGLVGLEAISAAVPVLVSDRSGLGEMLCDHGTPSARRAVVQTSGVDDDPDIAAWKRAIDGVLRNREAAYQDAATRREELAPKLDWKVAAEKLVAALREVRRA